MDIGQHLWQERYRPDSIKKMVLPKDLKNAFLKYIQDGVIPHQIFHSKNPGSGKSSAARALCNDTGLEKYDYKYINGSLDANVDTLRTEITQFVTSASISGNRKVVILDDMGPKTRDFQEALKVFIEQYSKNTTFIITTNNLNNIIEPVRSRCKIKDFNFSSPSERAEIFGTIVGRFRKMLDLEKVEYDLGTVNRVCDKYYPDIRKMTGTLQDLYDTYGKIPADVNITTKEQDEKLFEMILSKDILGARKFLIENGYDYGSLYTTLFNELVPRIQSQESQNAAILVLGKWADVHTRSIDFELTFSACLIELIGKLR